MVRELMHDPMFLRQRSTPCTPEDLQIAEDLLDTLRAHLDSCVGMAANMIGEKKNIIAVCVGFLQVPMLNPVIVRKAKPYTTEEGCLSYLGGPVKTTRYEEIEVEYQNLQFQKVRAKYTGWTAQIIQHECDHLAGRLI